MVSRSLLTAIIGFLVGCLFYVAIDPSLVIVLILGGVGYLLGLILDNAEVKHQLETFHFSSIPATQKILQSTDIPGASIIYSPKENQTSVLIDFFVQTKPQDIRLSVLKNLQENELRMVEDSKKTFLSLILDYPDFNYPKISLKQKSEFHFDIHERGLDFQNAAQKIVPGLVLSPLQSTEIFSEEESRMNLRLSSQTSPQAPPPSPPSPPSDMFPDDSPRKRVRPPIEEIDRKKIFKELIDYPPSPELEESEQNGAERLYSPKDDEIDESEILEDLFESSSDSSFEPDVPDLSPEDVEQLQNLNQRQLEGFLNEESPESAVPSLMSANELFKAEQEEISLDEIKHEVSSVFQRSPDDDKTSGFDKEIVDQIKRETQEGIQKVKPKSEQHIETSDVENDLQAKIGDEDSTSSTVES